MRDIEQDDDLIMELVEQALSRPQEQQEFFLQKACAGNVDLFSQVWGYVQCENRMKGFLLEPIFQPFAAEQTFQPGEVLDNRFRIVREVAQGGMGVVYEVADDKLMRRIAIKCAKSGFRQQLSPEVRNASEISHPNVCKIFEIHSASTRLGQIDFITMEFLEGQTLAERLKGEPLPEQDRLAIAQQLSAGLAEAHRNHVIHGDLKSGNVILTNATDGSIRAVITDFGLAHRPTGAAGESRAEAVGGTPDYMAPELLEGANISAATDIYALGVILHELGCGSKPASKGEVAPKRSFPSGRWHEVVTRCLEEDPARRFESVEQIEKALKPRNPGRAIVAIVIAALIAIGTGMVAHEMGSASKKSIRLAMLPLESNMTTAWDVSKGVHGRLAELRDDPRVNVTVMPLKAEGASGVTHLLHGIVTQSGDRVLVSVTLSDIVSGVDYDWEKEYVERELGYIPTALAAFVTRTLHLSPPVIDATVNLAATQMYRMGLEYTLDTSRVDEAIETLQQAVDLDPDSPLTHAALADAEWVKYALTYDKQRLEAATQAVTNAQKRNQDLPQVLLAVCALRTIAGHAEDAIGECQRAIELSPNSGEAYRRLGLAYEANNQINEAAAAFKKTIDFAPDDFRTYQTLGTFFRRRGRYEEAVQTFTDMVRHAPDASSSHYTLAVAHGDAGNFAEAEKQFEIARKLGNTSNIEHGLAYVLMQEGRDEEAIAGYIEALDLEPQTPHLLWMNLGISYSRAKHEAKAFSAFRNAFVQAKIASTKNFRSGRTYSELAYIEARLHDKAAAIFEAEQALEFSPKDLDTRLNIAATYEFLDMRKSTFAMLRTTPQSMLPGLLGRIKRYPDMADLHKDPEFADMLRTYHVEQQKETSNGQN